MWIRDRSTPTCPRPSRARVASGVMENSFIRCCITENLLSYRALFASILPQRPGGCHLPERKKTDSRNSLPAVCFKDRITARSCRKAACPRLPSGEPWELPASPRLPRYSQPGGCPGGGHHRARPDGLCRHVRPGDPAGACGDSACLLYTSRCV